MNVFLPTILEFLVLAAIILGFFFEDKVARFERKFFRKLKRKTLKVINGKGLVTAKKHCV